MSETSFKDLAEWLNKPISEARNTKLRRALVRARDHYLAQPGLLSERTHEELCNLENFLVPAYRHSRKLSRAKHKAWENPLLQIHYVFQYEMDRIAWGDEWGSE